jgi:hypothetical protein
MPDKGTEPRRSLDDVARGDRETRREHPAHVQPPVDQFVLVREIERTLQFGEGHRDRARRPNGTPDLSGFLTGELRDEVDRRVLVRVGITSRLSDHCLIRLHRLRVLFDEIVARDPSRDEKARRDGVQRLRQHASVPAGEGDREERRLENAGVDASGQERGKLFGRRQFDGFEAGTVAAVGVDPAASSEGVEIFEGVDADDFTVQIARRSDRRIGLHEQHRIGVFAEVERFGGDELDRDVVRDRRERREKASGSDVGRAADERGEARGAAARIDQVDRETVRGEKALLLRPQQRFDRVGAYREDAQRLHRLRASRRGSQKRHERRGGGEPHEAAAIEAAHVLYPLVVSDAARYAGPTA